MKKRNWIWGGAALAPAALICNWAWANPTLPTIGSASYNVSKSDSAIGTSATIETGTTTAVATNNTTVINDYIAYAAAHGGGTVVIPTGTYLANEILLGNNVDLDVQTGATLQDFSTKNTFVAPATGTTGNIEISGGGVLNNNATGTSDNKMVNLQGLNNVEVANVTIENAPNEHLVTECDSNVTINNVTIQDPLKTQANTDGIDFSGTNFLIENSHISAGDDDIVAKPDRNTANGIDAYTANVVINNCTITAGHGISIGGQTNAGLNGMYVNNCTFNATTSNPITDGFHLKAGDGNSTATQNGGAVQNVTFNNITMTNVKDALVIDSYYNNGSSNLPNIPAPAAPTDSTEPTWKDITFENIKVTAASGNAAEFYGLNSSPANLIGLNVLNVNITSKNPYQMYYSDSVYNSNLIVNGVAIGNADGTYKGSGGKNEAQEADNTYATAANPIYLPSGSNVVANALSEDTLNLPIEPNVVAAVPEPASLSLIAAASGLGLMRRRRK